MQLNNPASRHSSRQPYTTQRAFILTSDSDDDDREPRFHHNKPFVRRESLEVWKAYLREGRQFLLGNMIRSRSNLMRSMTSTRSRLKQYPGSSGEQLRSIAHLSLDVLGSVTAGKTAVYLHTIEHLADVVSLARGVSASPCKVSFRAPNRRMRGAFPIVNCQAGRIFGFPNATIAEYAWAERDEREVQMAGSISEDGRICTETVFHWSGPRRSCYWKLEHKANWKRGEELLRVPPRS